MSVRKTFSVEALKDRINSQLRDAGTTDDFRHGLMNVLEGVLMDSGNYRGFSYLTAAEVPAGQKPGIRYDVAGDPVFDELTDATRVHYF